ncbi:hypothetical protein AURDEDRAFT_114980 [Auricularia subglabra TFB-10046 SS5]|nr:hypothetical protein AURDEDRAFT_114980 [Auricularia subglabra TFB-10046 SS5]
MPARPETPLVLFVSGSGITPMPGFLQERAAQKAAERAVGPALLFHGCREADVDFLCADGGLQTPAAHDVVVLRPAFSRALDLSHRRRYVQE